MLFLLVIKPGTAIAPVVRKQQNEYSLSKEGYYDNRRGLEEDKPIQTHVR